MLSTYPACIGEPESSQDTPLRNTTPLKRRGPNHDAHLAPAKKTRKPKMNQCQSLFHQIRTSREHEDRFDLNYEAIDNMLSDMDKGLDDNKAYIQHTKEDDDGLLQLIQELEERSKAAKQSNDLLGAEVAKLAVISGGRQSKPAGTDTPDYDELEDRLLVRKYTTAHNERAEALESALVNTDKVKEQVEDFKGGLCQVRAELSAQVEQVRLEYEARLSQQRKELEEKARKRKDKFRDMLNEKQQIIDDEKLQARRDLDYGQFVLNRIHLKGAWKEDLKEQLTAEWSSRLADADEKIAKLSSKLAAAEGAKKDAASRLTATNNSLDIVTREKLEWKERALTVSNKKEELRSRFVALEAEATAKIKEGSCRLRESSQKLQDARKSLIGSKAWATRTRKELDVSRSDYATLLIEVALVQKQKLSVARRHKSQLDDYLVKARSMVKHLEDTVDGLYTKLKASVKQVEGRDVQLVKKDKLLESKTTSLEQLRKELDAEQQTLDEGRRAIQANQSRIQQLDKTNVQLEAALKTKNRLLASNAIQLSDKTLEIQNLTDRASSAAEELLVQRSIVTRKDERIREFERANKMKEGTMKELHSNLGLKESELKANVSAIRSQERRIRELENANQSLLKKETQAGIAMTQLAADMSKLNLDLDTKKEELKAQVALLNQKNAAICGLEATNTCLAQDKAKTTNEMNVLESRLATLDSDLRTKNDELRSQAYVAVGKDEKIETLEATNARLIEAQEEAKQDKANLLIANEDANARNEDANARLTKLKGKLDACEKKLSVADQETEQTRRSLEQVRKDLSAEKSANRTVSLKKILAIADDKIETLSTDLRHKTECLEKERSNKASLLSAINNGRIFQGMLAGEMVLVQALKFPGERKALLIIEKGPHTRMVWHESLGNCTVQLANWVWQLRLKGGSDGEVAGPIEVRIKFSDSPDLEEWLKGSYSTKDNVGVEYL